MTIGSLPVYRVMSVTVLFWMSSIYPFLTISVCRPMQCHLRVNPVLSCCLSTCLSAFLYVYLFVCLYICLYICLCASIAFYLSVDRIANRKLSDMFLLFWIYFFKHIKTSRVCIISFRVKRQFLFDVQKIQTIKELLKQGHANSLLLTPFLHL